MNSVALPQPETTEESAAHSNPAARYIPLGVWLAIIITLAWIPFKVISYGYLPPDDALRHAGKAVSEKAWSEILVVRDGFEMDASPGWHWLLSQVHHFTQMGTDGLVAACVVGAFLVALLWPILAVGRPEAWVAAMLISLFSFSPVIYRVLYGRPLAVTMAVTFYVLLMWRQAEERSPSWGKLVATTFLLAASAWLHGCWYLFGLVISAFALAGQWRAALRLAGCWAVGTLLGASLTGHPIEFLLFQLRIMSNSLIESPLQRMLVMEYQPTDGNILTIVVVVSLLLWRYAAGRWTWQCVNNPIFMLALLGWVLGLRFGRFFYDWGSPALLVWIALELNEHLQRHLAAGSIQRLGITGGLCASLFFGLTTDANSRWTRALDLEFLSEKDPEMAPWLPEKGGILYSWDMAVFYQTIYKNPHAPWRYILGFNDIFMPLEDLRILRNIQRNFGAYKSYEPWVRKMHPEDRLVLRSAEGAAPNIPGLEWHYTAREIWVGRKPRAPEFSRSRTDAAPGTLDSTDLDPSAGLGIGESLDHLRLP